MALTSENLENQKAFAEEHSVAVSPNATPSLVALQTGGIDRPYAFGLAMAVLAKGITLDVIGSDAVDSPEMHTTPGLTFLNLQGEKSSNASVGKKVTRLLGYYKRLLAYAAHSRAKIFHILWNNKFQNFDRTFLMLYYKLKGKKLVFTAHNVNAGHRDGNDSWMNRLTLRIQYHLVDHILTHTPKMKAELAEKFGVRPEAVTVMHHPVNDVFPDTGLTSAEAKRKLGLEPENKAILFFGAIRSYKGLEYLVDAFHILVAKHPEYRLIIAAEPKKGSEKYLEDVLERIKAGGHHDKIIQRLEFIPDAETELYYKASDALALPYKEIFQSGVLFVGYNFGLPAVAADVGSFRADILEGKTGFVCKPNDPADLARVFELYFASDLYKNLAHRRREIREFAHSEYSWETAAEKIRTVYMNLLQRS